MEFDVLYRLLLPLIGVGVGIFLKVTDRSDLVRIKKLWIIFVVSSVFVFFFRLFKYFDN